jgi:hypothetical protein
MKYAALIFGDDERQPKAASAKLSSPEPGQVVRGIDGSVYRVASKFASPDGVAVKLSSLKGEPVQTPLNFRPVSRPMARLASWLRYHLAFDRRFDLYVNSYIERYNQQHKDNPLPYPMGHDGGPFRWADFLQKAISPKLYVPGRGDAEDKQAVKDELIHEMLFNVLGERDALSQFVSKAKSLGVNRQNAASKLTDWLTRAFYLRVEEMQNKINARSPEEEISMWQPPEWDAQGEDVNLLDTEEHAFHDKEFQSAEAKNDIAKFREGFRRWLAKPSNAGERAAENFVLMFDIFWRILQTGSDIKRSDIEDEWIGKTGLSFGSFKEYYTLLPEMIEKYITTHGTELGDKSIFSDLMDAIIAERGKRERKEKRQKERARPAMVSSLHIAAAEEDEKLTCLKCHRTSKASDSNNLQCPHCGGNMKTAGGAECPECGSADVDCSVTLGDKARCNACKHEWKKAARRAKRGSSRTYSKKAETVETQHGAITYEPGDVVNPDDYIPAGEFNPHNIRPWLIHNEYGTLAIVYASNEQDALDEAVDGDKMDSCLVQPECILTGTEGENPDDCTTHDHKIDEDVAYLGNASEPFDLTYIGIVPLPNQQYGVSEVATDEMLEGYEKEMIEEGDKKFLKDLGIQGSRKTAQRLVRGDQLTPDMVKQVKDAFIYRWTTDNKRRGSVYHCDKCDVRNNPYVNTQSAEGHQHPTIPLQTDDQWLREHAFYFTNRGKLLPNKHAQPSYLAPQAEQEQQPLFASVAYKFAMEKAAYNPGKGEYIYQADVYCEPCGDALRRRLDKQGKTPTDPSDESSYDSDQYPKGPYYNQEADGPEHCARCGTFLENPLTTEGYRHLNQMILEHEADGKGKSDIIEEWKAFYPEREQEGYTPDPVVDATLSQIEQDTDRDFLRDMRTSGKKQSALDDDENACDTCGSELERGACPSCGRAVQKGRAYDESVEREFHGGPAQRRKKGMLPHEFNNADGQAIRNETYPDTAYVSGEADTTEFRQPRVGAEGDSLEVARTILQQLGGNKFVAMTGARNIVGGQNNLSFRLPGSGGFTKDGINAVKIELDPSDTYKVTFMRIRGGKMSVVSEHDNVYAESLREVFEQATGLRTSLGTMGKRGDLSYSTVPPDMTTVGEDVLRDPGSAREQALNTSETLDKPWWCANCQTTVDMDVHGRCEHCDSEALDTASHGKPPKKLIPPVAGSKTAQGSGGTTVTMQNQNVTSPKAPGKGEPLAVPDSIDQVAGPHSPNAPATAPRTPSIQPRIVNVPVGTEGDDAMTSQASAKTAKYNGWFDVTHDSNDFQCPQCSAGLSVGNWNTEYGDAQPGDYTIECPDCGREFPLTIGVSTTYKTGSGPDEEIECPRCHGTNVEIDAPDPETYKIWCDDCEEFTHEGTLVPGSPVRDYREMPGDEWSTLERMGEPGGELEEGPEPDVDAMYEAERLDQFDKGAASDPTIPFSDSAPAPAGELSPETLPQMSDEEKERWLEKHGWVKENEHHGATWWMQRQMWYKKDHEEDIPYQDTDDAVEKELDLMERHKEGSKTAYFEHNLGQSNSYWRVTQPFEVLEVTGHQPSNTWIGRSQVLDPIYEKVSLPAGAIIENLHGGLFFKMDEKDERHPFVLAKNPKHIFEKRYMPDKHEFPLDKLEKVGAGSNSGSDDDRGAGDLWRENFYEHRTLGIPTEGLLSGMKEGADLAKGRKLPPNTVIREVCDRSAEKMGYVHGAYDGTPEDMVRVAQEITEQMFSEYNDASNSESRIFATDETGKLRWRVSPNFQHVVEGTKLGAAPAGAAMAPAPIHPNVQQQMNMQNQEQAQQTQGGPVIAITPGQQEQEPKRERHTIEPELPNARYHMMGMLAAAEEDRMLREDPEYSQWADMLSEVDPEALANPDMFTEEERKAWPPHTAVCEECGLEKPDVQWEVIEELGAGDPNDPMKPLQGWFCRDCSLDLAQDI